MRLARKDIIATALVAVALLLYVLWALSAAPSALSGTRAIGIVVLGLGFVASANAVVPTFTELLHGNKTYAAVTSLLGLVALVGGVLMLVRDSGTGLTIMMAAMLVLWLISTIHHTLLAKTGLRSTRGLPASARHTGAGRA